MDELGVTVDGVKLVDYITQKSAEIAALKELVREMAGKLSYTGRPSPEQLKQREAILNRPEVQAILKEKK